MLCQHDFSADEGASRHCIPTSASIPVDHIARRARFCHWPLLRPLSSVESASMGKGARGQTKKKEAVPNINSLAYSLVEYNFSYYQSYQLARLLYC